MSPFQISILLHYHVQGFKPYPRSEATAEGANMIDETILSFVSDGLLSITEDGFTTTRMGQKMVAMLCATPYPVSVYADPRELKPVEGN